MKYQITKEMRDEVVAYLSSLVVPVSVGVNIANICNALGKLEEIKEEEKATD